MPDLARLPHHLRQMFDALVVGAGPGGTSAAYHMNRAGMDVLLVDAADVPRDKVCGDALSRRAVASLAEMGIIDLESGCDALPMTGVRFGTATGASVPLDFDPLRPAAYVCPRRTLDARLVAAARESGVAFWPHARVTDLLQENGRVVGANVTRLQAADSADSDERFPRTETIRAPLVIGADGTYSVVARELRLPPVGEKHLCSGIRGYFEGVSFPDSAPKLEFHLIDHDLPAYLWIFPLSDGRANVGLGMLTSSVREHGIQLKDFMMDYLGLPHLRDRFEGADLVGVTKAWALPLGTYTRQISGNGWMLVGDAASIADPFAGEGVAAALRSGEVSARIAAEAAQKAEFSADVLKAYPRTLKREFDADFRLGERLRRLGNWRWFRESLIEKGGKSPEFSRIVASYLDDERRTKKLASPLFLMRLLTA